MPLVPRQPQGSALGWRQRVWRRRQLVFERRGGYDSGYGGGGGYSAGGYGGGGGYGNRSSGPREMFTATCSSCGKEARVPFRPTNGKPVYCSDCFRTMRGG